jgi:hypothetical protein
MILPNDINEGAGEERGISIESVMEKWEAEDKPKSEYVITMQPTLNDQWSRWNTVSWGEPLPMTSGKNISPFRVQKRRRKKKAARKARR